MTMPTSIRLTKEEQKLLHEKAIEINKKLMGQNQMPLKESELIHEVLTMALKAVSVNSSSEIELSKR